MSQEVIEHIQDQTAYLATAHHVLAAGGQLILTTPNAYTVLAMPEDQRSHQPVENWRTSAELRALLAGAGFSRIRISTIALGYGHSGPHRVVNSEKLAATLRRLRVHQWFTRAALDAGFGLHLVATATK